jgi:hypothetical protein
MGLSMTGNRKRAWFRAAAFVGLATLAWIALAPRVQAQSNTAPQYTANHSKLRGSRT